MSDLACSAITFLSEPARQDLNGFLHRRPSPSPAMAATGDLLLPQLASALVAVPPTFDAARCSLEINEREVAECLE